MASDPKVPEATGSRSEETPEGAGQDELSQETAPSVETDSTRLARSHYGGPAPRSPSLGIGFLVKQRSRRQRGDKEACPYPRLRHVRTDRTLGQNPGSIRSNSQRKSGCTTSIFQLPTSRGSNHGP